MFASFFASPSCRPFIWLTTALAAVVWSGSALADTSPEPEVEVHGDWRVSCIQPEDGQRRCVATQLQVEKESGQRVLGIELLWQADGSVRGLLAMPFGLLLQPGVRMAVDEGEDIGESHAFVSCLPDGCLVPLHLARGDLDHLRRGSHLNVRALAMADRSVVRFPISLKGITAALRVLEARQS